MTRIQISRDPSGRIIASFLSKPLVFSKGKTIEDCRRHPVRNELAFLIGYIQMSAKDIGKTKSALDNLNLNRGGDV